MAVPTQTYTAESTARRPGEVLRAMLSGVVRSRYMGYRLFLRDLRAEYSRVAFGVFWDFVDPLVLGVIFYFLMQLRVINAGELSMPYALFVIYGLLLYRTFSESVTLSLDVMHRSRTILTQLRLPPEALLLAVLFRVLFNSTFRVAVMLAFSIALYSTAAAEGQSALSLVGFAKFLACYPLLILAGMSIGVFLAPFNVIYGDVGRATRILLFPLRYATPVLYAIPTAYPFNWVNALNPVSAILSGLRSLATSNTISDVGDLFARSGLFAVLFFVGWVLFHISIPVLAERA
ncbi:MAG: hypothetical protein IID08_07935 [Candidatus Hydrogenedentes bacterium]|nr:hypothetical protein [Candidatus Hydrogenedentota bacterium]